MELRATWWRRTCAVAATAAVAALLPLAGPAAGQTGDVAFASPTLAVDEAAPSIDVVVTRTSGTDAIEVDWVVLPGATANDPADYSGPGTNTLAWPTGDTTDKTISFTPVDDLDGEPAEAFTVALTEVRNIDVPGPPVVLTGVETVVTITDDGDAGSLAISTPANVTETDADQSISITATRSGGSEGAVSTTVTSSAPADLVVTGGAASWANGEDGAKTISADVVGDNLVEADQVVSIGFGTVTGGAATGATDTTTIVDDDSNGQLRISSGLPATLTETDADQVVQVTVERVGDTAGAVSTVLTSVRPADLAIVGSGLVSWADGEAGGRNVQVQLIGDDADEADEPITVELTTFTGGAVAGTPDASSSTIEDDDATPVAAPDSYSTPEDVPLNVAAPGVRANDTDADTAAAGLTVVSNTAFNPAGLGSVSLNANGSFTFTPQPEATGTGSFTYTLSDGTQSDTATVTIEVTGSNDPPVAVNDTYTTGEDEQLVVATAGTGVRANDTDPEDATGALEVTFPAATLQGGTLTGTGANGTFTYTPPANFSGTDSFTYTVRDTGNATDQGTVTINVTAVNDQPVAGNDAYSTAEDVVLVVPGPGQPSLLANDSDADGPVTIDVVNPLVPDAAGDIDVNRATGGFVFTPAQNFNGPVTFSYTVTDGSGGSDGAQVTIQVTAVNDPPVAVNDSYGTPEDTVLTVGAENGPRVNDIDPDDLLDLDLPAASQAGGTVEQLNNVDGRFRYTPPLNFVGIDRFTYRASDGEFETTAEIVIDVGDVNDDPVAPDLNVWPERSSATVIDLTGRITDTDAGDVLSVTVTSEPTLPGATVDCAGMQCTYDPPDDTVSIDTLTYQASDQRGGIDTGTLTLYVGFPHTAQFVGRGCEIDLRLGEGPNGTPAGEVICGTDGNDVIDAGGGDDWVVGMQGNDVLSGGAGNDVMSGGRGDDELRPGSDVNESLGGPGFDRAVYAATPLDETLVATGESTTLVSGLSTHIAVDEVELSADAGADIVSVTPSALVSFDLRGGSGFDRLIYNTAGLSGVRRDGNTISATGRLPVVFAGFDAVNLGAFFVPGTPGNDVVRFLSSTTAGLQIDLLGGSDSLTVDFGRLAGPVIVTDSGTTGTDRLTLLGTAAADNVTLTSASARRGTERVSFSDQERVVMTGGGGEDIVTLALPGTPAAAATVPTISVNGGGGRDVLIVTSPGPACATWSGSAVLFPGLPPIAVPDVEVIDLRCPGGGRIVSLIDGYWVAASGGSVRAFGGVPDLGGVTSPASPVGAIATAPDKSGYWVALQNGDVVPFGSARYHGSVRSHLPPGVGLDAPIVSMTSTRSGRGYYLLGRDGGVFSFGDGAFYGSTGGIPLAAPVVAMAANPVGRGYWFVASDGGIFAFGPDTRFFGSVPGVLPPGRSLDAPIVGMAPTATGRGYWLVASDGGVFTFGDARFLGSVPGVLGPLGQTLASPIVGMVATVTGRGYWLVAADGGVFTFGDAQFLGSDGGQGRSDVVGLAG